MIFNQEVKVFKTRENAKIPVRAHEGDAGIDFFFCPPSNDSVTIDPGSTAIMPTGIKMQVPSNHMLQIMNKSGIASKRSLLVGACVVDYGYNGEIFVNLHNCGVDPQTLHPGDKLAQGVFVTISRPVMTQIAEDDVYGFETSRGSGALGSTGDR